MTDQPAVRGFHGRYFFLSNFSASPIRMRGLTYPTVEHAFQAAKTLDQAQRERIAAAREPGEAKAIGRRVTLRAGWEDGLRDEVMLACLRAKFRPDSDLSAQLLATGDAELVEDNTWGDRYWGVCAGAGENRLGKLLMQVRSELATVADC